MISAFNNDPQLKAALRDRLKCHLDDGSLKIGATFWDGTSGSPLGVSIRGSDASQYEEQYGYPLPVAVLLDPLSDAFGSRDHAAGFVCDWVDVVTPGSDLAAAPYKIVGEFLRSSHAAESYPEPVSKILELQQADLAGQAPPRSEWSALRQQVSQAKESDSPKDKFHAQLCEVACWPISRSRSVLPEVARVWIGLGAPPTPDWDRELALECHTAFGSVFEEARARGEKLSYQDGDALFHEKFPELAARGDVMLAAQERTRLEHVSRAGSIVLNALAGTN